MTVGNKVTAYKYNKNDELLRTDTLNTDMEEDSVVIYKNDKNGNQLATVNRYEIPIDKKDSSYVDIDVTLGDNRLNENVVNHYNALNQLTQTLTKNYKVSFTYDAEGLRTSKIVNGEKTFFVWDGDQLVMELSESGKVQKRYIRGNDLIYADKGENTEKQYYVTDPHGNVVQLTDGSGAVIKTYEYDSFGNEVNPDSKDDNPFRYCGEYYDKETEEIYLRARYYQPSVGRFITRDTYTGESDEPLSLHLYTYCENDGVNAWDPSGNRAIPVAKGAPKYEPKKWNKESVRIRTNCYAYAFNLKKNPITKQNFGTGENSIFAMQPGMFSNSIITEPITAERVVERVKSDAKAMNYKFKKVKNKKIYKKVSNKKTWLVYLVVTKKQYSDSTYKYIKTKNCLEREIADYHWYRQDKNGKWSHKPGSTAVTNLDAKKKKIKNPKKASRSSRQYIGDYNGKKVYVRIDYSIGVGFFKVTKK